jgi:hypothetical protein
MRCRHAEEVQLMSTTFGSERRLAVAVGHSEAEAEDNVEKRLSRVASTPTTDCPLSATLA